MRITSALVTGGFCFVCMYAHAGGPAILECSLQAGDPPAWLSGPQPGAQSPATKDAAETVSPAGEAPPALHAAREIRSSDLWERVRTGFSLEASDDPLIQDREAWYLNHSEYLKRALERSKRYLFYIVEEVDRRGMPMEIALLPIVESAFVPTAYSRAQASGIWQFIPSTGKNYGLQQSWWYDGRRDIQASTNAALDYLQSLHDTFGDWELALAAYNWGENGVSRAIERNQAKGLAIDYRSLDLPRETRYYIPKLMALRNIIADPGSFGLELEPIADSRYFSSLTTALHIDTKLAARLAEMRLDDFLSLNPAYKKPVITASSTVLLPSEKAETFQENLQKYSGRLVSWQAYTPKRGEDMQHVAEKFGISLATLKTLNGVSPRRRIPPGETLLVPVDAKTAREDLSFVARLEAAYRTPRAVLRRAYYHVRHGDTLATVAKHFRVAVADLKRWNLFATRRALHPGDRLALFTPRS